MINNISNSPNEAQWNLLPVIAGGTASLEHPFPNLLILRHLLKGIYMKRCKKAVQ
jgi:hypothetical protein